MKQDRKQIIRQLTSMVRNVPDFPKPGIQFKDISPLLQDAQALQMISTLLAQPFDKINIDYVVGLEARGFLLGPRLAQDLQAGFIPVRKPGKLPAKTIEAAYDLEYGSDVLEMHADAISPGDVVVIHDDLIATGGTAKAAGELVQKLKGEVAGYSFVMELAQLEGRKHLPEKAIIDILLAL